MILALSEVLQLINVNKLHAIALWQLKQALSLVKVRLTVSMVRPRKSPIWGRVIGRSCPLRRLRPAKANRKPATRTMALRWPVMNMVARGRQLSRECFIQLEGKRRIPAGGPMQRRGGIQRSRVSLMTLSCREQRRTLPPGTNAWWDAFGEHKLLRLDAAQAALRKYLARSRSWQAWLRCEKRNGGELPGWLPN